MSLAVLELVFCEQQVLVVALARCLRPNVVADVLPRKPFTFLPLFYEPDEHLPFRLVPLAVLSNLHWSGTGVCWCVLQNMRITRFLKNAPTHLLK